MRDWEALGTPHSRVANSFRQTIDEVMDVEVEGEIAWHRKRQQEEEPTPPTPASQLDVIVMFPSSSYHVVADVFAQGEEVQRAVARRG